jgi:protoheme ferro-lyase
MVFMNMGGPSTTDEVGGFLSRLFVCVVSVIVQVQADRCRLMLISFPSAAFKTTSDL